MEARSDYSLPIGEKIILQALDEALNTPGMDLEEAAALIMARLSVAYNITSRRDGTEERVLNGQPLNPLPQESEDIFE